MHLAYLLKFCITMNCFQFLLGITFVPREIKDNDCVKFCWVNKVNYGLCENFELY